MFVLGSRQTAAGSEVVVVIHTRNDKLCQAMLVVVRLRFFLLPRVLSALTTLDNVLPVAASSSGWGACSCITRALKPPSSRSSCFCGHRMSFTITARIIEMKTVNQMKMRRHVITQPKTRMLRWLSALAIAKVAVHNAGESVLASSSIKAYRGLS